MGAETSDVKRSPFIVSTGQGDDDNRDSGDNFDNGDDIGVLRFGE